MRKDESLQGSQIKDLTSLVAHVLIRDLVIQYPISLEMLILWPD